MGTIGYCQPIGASPLYQEGGVQRLSQISDDDGIFDGRAVLAPSVIAKPVLVRLRRRVAPIEEKSMMNINVWSYKRRYVSEQLETPRRRPPSKRGMMWLTLYASASSGPIAAFSGSNWRQEHEEAILIFSTKNNDFWSHNTLSSEPSQWSFLCSGLSANLSACSCMSPLPSAKLSSTHHGWCWMRLVWSKSVGGTNSYTITTIV